MIMLDAIESSTYLLVEIRHIDARLQQFHDLPRDIGPFLIDFFLCSILLDTTNYNTFRWLREKVIQDIQ